MNVKRSISLAITDDARPGAVLIVQRPDDDEDLPGAWGLPAASLGPDESWADAGRRAGREKLGVELHVGDVLQEGSLQRARYRLDMRLYAARVVHGQPLVPQAVAGVTQYQAWRWGAAADVEPAAARGSLCSRLYLAWAGSSG
jgi:8-oxo-dGTP diphosphatase